MKRALVVAVVALVTASSALADRPANQTERAGIMAVVARMGSFDPGPPACNRPIIRVSTWDPDFATWLAKDWKSGPCAKYGGGADGLNFFRKSFGSWLFLTRSPAVPLCGSYVQGVSFAVLADFLGCPGGPKKATCFTENGPGFVADVAADASYKVQQVMKACYPADYRRITRVGFSGLPKSHGKAVSLVVKTKLPASDASTGQARTICQDASTAAKWFRYDNFEVAVLGSGSKTIGQASWVPGHDHPC